jgi:Tfp pilus assembly protein PilO
MRLKPTKNTIVLLGGLTGVLALGTPGSFWVGSQALASTTKTLEAKQAELNDGERIARRRDTARDALEADRSQLRYLETAVSDAAYVPTLLKQLEDLARSTNNKVLSVRPSVDTSGPSKIEQRRDPDAADEKDGGEVKDKENKKAPDPYTRLNIQVVLVGGFNSVQQFVERLTRFPKIIAVDQIQLRPHQAQDGDRESKLDVDLKLVAFVMKESPRAAARTAPANADAEGSK